MNGRPTPAALIAGVVVFIATVAGWLIAEDRGIDSGPLWFIAGPVVGALFIASPLTKAADAAQQAATQTNGGLEGRIQAAVATALAARDAARTRQAQGDIAEDVVRQTPPTPPVYPPTRATVDG